MAGDDHELMSEDLQRAAYQVRDKRPKLSALELDTLKARITARAGSPGGLRGATLRGRVAIAVVLLGLMGAGAGGVMAGSGGSSGGASAVAAQYKSQHKKKKPKVAPKPPDKVTRRTAELRGYLKPGKLRTAYYFMYGACRHYPGDRRTTRTKHATQNQYVRTIVRHLRPNTRYCFQLVAANRKGTVRSRIEHFRTKPVTRSAQNGRGFTG